MGNVTNSIRINKFDNLKGFAIFLIVLGHVAYSMNISSLNYFNRFIFIFHLPIFFFVAGYFSKITLDQQVKSFKRLFLPYVLFTVIYRIFYIPFGGINSVIFIYPTFALWFLLVLFIMKMALPIFDNLKYPVLVSFILALLFGLLMYDGDILALSRLFAYMPIFLVGFYYKKYSIIFKNSYEKLYNFMNNNLFVGISSVIIIILSVFIANYVSLSAIIMQAPYKHHFLINIVIRAVIISLGIAGTLILNKLMVDKECFLTKWGKNSMTIYILHIFIIVFLRRCLKIFSYQNEIVSWLFVWLLTFLIVFLLSRDVISQYFNKIIESFGNLILNV